GLTAEQLRAILAHELAHVRRYDYLVNLLQSVVETLLFYHPAVWWVSRRIRIEREHCCDDLAVAACGDRLTYARALAEMEHLRGGRTMLAAAATGGSLLSRIQRLIGAPTSKADRPAQWIGGLAAIGAILAIGAGVHLAAFASDSKTAAEHAGEE